MVKAVKTTKTETEFMLPTPFYYLYDSSERHHTMFGMITDTEVYEISYNKDNDFDYEGYEFTKKSNIKPDDIYEYMYENPITKEEFDAKYASVMAILQNKEWE